MVKIDDVIKLDIKEDDIKKILKTAISKEFNKRDNLRNRHSNVQFDSLIRGYIGEVAIKKWFLKYDIIFDDQTNHSYDNGEIDIDLLYRYKDGKTKTLEIKTSLVPDSCCTKDERDLEKIEKCIKKYDIKLIRRENKPIEELKGDIHIQIYYAHLRKLKDEALKRVNLSFNIENINDINIAIDKFLEKIYNNFYLKEYIGRSYFVGWIDKNTLIKQINSKEPKNRLWSFKNSKREFWSCNIHKETKKPIEIIEYLKSLD